MSPSKNAFLKTVASVVAALALHSVQIAEAQSNQTTSPVPGAIPSLEWNWGMPTNGICGEAAVHWSSGRGQLPDVQIRIVDTNASCIFGGESRGEAIDGTIGGKAYPLGDLLDRLSHDKWLCFGPTNLFCGPVQLRDAAGRELPPLKPEVSSPEAYPESFSVAQARKQRPDPRTAFPLALYGWAPQLARFNLGDYFAIDKPGAYRLTVWPKIYKRSTGNPDLCERIDVPPVAVTIDWTEPPAK